MDALNQRWRPVVGSISTDRVAISGNCGILDLFDGGNNYYYKYIQRRNFELERSIIDYVVNVREILTHSVQSFLYLIVPNKASCLPENYPMWLPENPTVTFSGVRSALDCFSGNFFANWMLRGTLVERRALWFETDSHWNSAGARLAAMELLRAIKGVIPEVRVTEEVSEWGGDLSGRWGSGKFASETIQRHLGFDAERVIVQDNGNGVIQSANTGRYLHWHNSSARMNISVLIIGDSFSGTGLVPENMTYWFSMVFENTYFLHSALVPVDILESIKVDVVIFQTNERFLGLPDSREISLECLTKQFSDRIMGDQSE